MQLDVNEIVLGYDGTPIPGAAVLAGDREHATLGALIALALNHLGQGENPPTEQKLRMARLTEAVFRAEREDGLLEIEMATDGKFIQEQAGLHISAPLLHLRLVDMLDAADKAAKEAPKEPEMDASANGHDADAKIERPDPTRMLDETAPLAE